MTINLLSLSPTPTFLLPPCPALFVSSLLFLRVFFWLLLAWLSILPPDSWQGANQSKCKKCFKLFSEHSIYWFKNISFEKYMHFGVDKGILSHNRLKQCCWLGRGDAIFLDLITWLKKEKKSSETTSFFFFFSCPSILILQLLLLIGFYFYFFLLFTASAVINFDL